MNDPHDLTQRRSRLTPQQQALLAQRLRGTAASPARPLIARRAGSGTAPLSHAQQRHWFLWQLAPHNTAYHLSAALRLEGSLNTEAMQASIDALVARHEALRTVFRTDEAGQVWQHIQPAATVPLHLTDLRPLPQPEREQQARELARQLAETPFDLTTGPLLRLRLVQLGEQDHLLAVSMHHIASDAWSKAIFLREFAAHYRARVTGTPPEPGELPDLPIQYADYAQWQRQWLDAGEKDRQMAYWRAQLGQEQPVLQLPCDHPRRADLPRRGGRHRIDVPGDLVMALQARGHTHASSLFTVLLTGFAILLRVHGDQPDVRIGVPIANRHREGTQDLIGFFVNTQVMRSHLDSRQTLGDALAQMRDAALGAHAHPDLPFELLVEALQPERSLTHPPLFQAMFNHLREDHRALHTLPGLVLKGYDTVQQAAAFDIALDTTEHTDGRLSATFTYAAALFEAGTIERLARHYLRVLDHLAHQPDLPLHRLKLLDAAETRQLEAWSRNERTHAAAAHQPIHQLIAQQARRQPQAEALVFGQTALSRAELNQRANRLAHRLIRQGIGPEIRVGMAVERSIEMVVGLLAILKAGGAYVPLDPDLPPDRLAYMAQDSGVRLLLTQSHLSDRVPRGLDVEMLALDRLDLLDQPTHDPDVPVHGENLAYVIYTSGSTGRPKGAANRHAALHNRLAWMQSAYPLTEADTVLHKTPFSFDVSVWEFFWPLMCGARLAVAAPGAHRDPVQLCEAIRHHDATVIHFVPSMLQALAAHPGASACNTLRHVVCSGEALPTALQERAFALWPQAQLHNLYGPTEAAIDVTHWTCTAEGGRPVPIGRPIDHTQAWVLDAELCAVPPGVAGELYLGGIGLGRGYLQRSALTAERFVAHPFSPHGERLYRTGDLARWRADGQLDYLGRTDHQIKVRGMRIELGEIEASLMAQAGVREAVVTPWQAESDSDARLVAYVVPHAGTTLHTDALRDALARALPEHMLPAAILTMAALPLNPSGKVDRKALPAPALPATSCYEAPQGEIEQALAEIWKTVLRVPLPGRRDNFFALGGHSLLATQVAARIQNALQATVSVADLFQAQTLMALAKLVQASRPAEAAQALHELDAFMDSLETP